MFKQSSLYVFALLAIFNCRPSHASCEGTGPEMLLAAWYDPGSGQLIKEAGDLSPTVDAIHEFTLEDGARTDEFMAVSWVQNFGANNQVAEISGKGEVELQIISSSKNVLDLGKELRSRMEKIGWVRDNLLPPEKTEKAYKELLANVRNWIAKETGFVPLTPLATCPYYLKTHWWNSSRIVYVKDNHGSENVAGELRQDFPGDDSSPTTITAEATCWGANDKPVLLAFHWNWECEGEGDLTALIGTLQSQHF